VPDTYDCGHEIPDVEPPALVAAGGWCMPSEVYYNLMKDEPTSCSDCKARMHMIAEFGIDPGRNGENLRFPRGGITYGATDA
jgi:hypothetical protein